MNKFRGFVLTAIVVAIVVGLATTYIQELDERFKSIAFWIVMGVVVLWGVVEATAQLLAVLYFGKGRYAVLIFVLDDADRLLLVTHPYHRRLITPGGRLKVLELPHDAVARVLRTEAGISTFEFSSLFHAKQAAYTESVTIVPQPYMVQREDRKQRGFVRFHYAFVYVVRCAHGNVGAIPQYQPTWYSRSEIEKLMSPDRPFDDVVDRYDDILARIAAHKVGAGTETVVDGVPHRPAR